MSAFWICRLCGPSLLSTGGVCQWWNSTCPSCEAASCHKHFCHRRQDLSCAIPPVQVCEKVNALWWRTVPSATATSVLRVAWATNRLPSSFVDATCRFYTQCCCAESTAPAQAAVEGRPCDISVGFSITCSMVHFCTQGNEQCPCLPNALKPFFCVFVLWHLFWPNLRKEAEQISPRFTGTSNHPC